MTVIDIYAANEDATVQEKKNYETLNDLFAEVRDTENNRDIMVIGDLSARIGNKDTKNVVGQYEQEAKNYRERLINFCGQNNLKIWNASLNTGTFINTRGNKNQ